jgi:FkbM family methyltransferase
MLNTFFKIRDYLLRNHSRQIRVGKFKILANWGHVLPRIIEKRPEYALNLPRIVKAVKEKYPNMTLVDVGANVGDTVALLRSHVHCPIICIEGDEYYYRYLEKNINQFDDVKIFKSFLGDKNQSITTKKDFSNGTLSINSNNGQDSIVSIERLDDFLDKVGQGDLDIKFIKIDTDGFDTKIIEGSLNILKKNAPILFFEFDRFFLSRSGINGLTIFPHLESLGYRQVMFFDNIGRFIIAVDIQDSQKISQLYHYTYKKDGAFPFYDLCIVHKNDEDLVAGLIKEELEK